MASVVSSENEGPQDEHCTCSSVETDGNGDIIHYWGCEMPEPEGSEEPPCPSCGQRVETWFDRSVCAEPCGSMHNRCSACGSAVGGCPNEAQPPRRPPYAVAYELQDGSAFEVALPGDATVRADDGLLIIHHAQSPVKGLVQVKPWGNQ